MDQADTYPGSAVPDLSSNHDMPTSDDAAEDGASTVGGQPPVPDTVRKEEVLEGSDNNDPNSGSSSADTLDSDELAPVDELENGATEPGDDTAEPGTDATEPRSDDDD